jgi:nitrite reductase (NADH) small subunit
MSETPKWIRAVRCEDIPLREGRAVKLGAREIAIFNLGDRFLAVASRCPHRNGPLAEGIISGQSVVCPLHAWKISLETGTVARPADTLACVETYPVRVEDGIVLVELAVPSSAAYESRTHCRFHRHDVPNLVEASCLQIEDSKDGTITA